MITLIRTKTEWTVSLETKRMFAAFSSTKHTHAHFPTIEKAADYMISKGVKDEEIDKALIDMSAYQSNRVTFDENGLYFCYGKRKSD